MAPKSEKQTAAKAFALSTTKVWLITFVAALCLTVVPMTSAAAEVQVSGARAAALQECSRLAARYPTNYWGNTDIQLYRSCMVRHGEKE